MVTYAQDARLLVLNTPLGKDVLLLAGFSGTEAMSRLFSYQLEMYSSKPAIAAKDIVGKNVTWCVQHKDKQPRYFNGFVSRFASGGRTHHDVYSYRAEVVPWLWFLTRTANCRIFQNQTAPQIIEKVFTDLGFKDFAPDLKRPCDKREYCVQYRETAFNFVSHLMEEEGILYFFRHENGKHTLVMADHVGAYKDCPENKVRYYGGKLAPNHLTEWSHQYEFRPGKWAQTDYNFEDPLKPLLTGTKTVIDLPGVDKFEVFDYPGDYFVKKDGEDEVKIRMEEEEAVHDVVTSAGECCTFTPGGKFKLDGHDVASESGKGYVVTSIQHSAVEASYGNSSQTSRYSNSFTCIPDGVVCRPTRITPRPVVMGPQPAVVVGPSGQELYTDKYGRVKVRFHWDRENKKDEDRTCWIRVSQPMAGKRWGTSFWPRIGQEVVVAFHEGDPDRPIIIGSVYNADQMPPYQGDGPDGAHKSDNHVSGFKSNTTKGGTGYNEFRFDDTKDKQQIFIHAERNMDTRVKKDGMENVGENRHLAVGKDQNEQVGGNKNLTVKKDHAEKIEGNMTLLVGGEGGNVDVVIKKVKKELIEADSHLHVKGKHQEQIDGDSHLTVGGSQLQSVTKKHGLDAGEEIYLVAGQKVVIEAGMELTLVQGANFIKLDAAGVTIFGAPMTLINSGGAPGKGTPVKVEPPTDAQEAKPAEPTPADDSKSGSKSAG